MRFYFTIICAISGLSSFGQSITNVASSQQGNNALITYDLNGNPGATYFVKLYYSTDGGQSFSNELLQVTGDVKSGVKTGIEKKIIWAADKEVNYLNGQVVFKVEAESRKISAKPVTIENTTVEIIKAVRNGDDLTVEFIFTQNTQDEVRVYTLLKKSQLTTQDGRQFDPVDGKLGSQRFNLYDGTNKVECPKGIPTRGTLTFKVESSDLVIPAIKIDIYSQSDSNKSFVIRSIPVQ
jgi:hypothetical protein